MLNTLMYVLNSVVGRSVKMDLRIINNDNLHLEHYCVN